MIRKFRCQSESVFGTLDGSPVQKFYLPMDTAGSFKPLITRPFWGMQDGTGQNVPRIRGSEIERVGGQLATRIYWESAAFYPLMAQRVNSGATLPWPTDQKKWDLASFTADFAYSFDDDTYKYVRYLGNKVGQNVRFECANTPETPFLMMTADLIGSLPVTSQYTATSAITISDLADPVAADLPQFPLTFQECVFTAYGGAMNFFDKFSISINNKVQPYFDNSRHANRIHCRGRTVTLTVHPLLQVANNPRLAYEAVTALGAMDITFTNPSTVGVTTTHEKLKFNFRSQSFLDSVSEEMILDADAYTDWSATALLDTSAGDDFTITHTPAS